MPLAAGTLRTLIATPAAHKHPGCLVPPFLLHRFSAFLRRPGVPHPPRATPEKGYTPTELFLWPCWVGGGPNDGVNVMPYEATWPRFFLLLSVKAQNGGRTSAPRQRSGSARYATRRRVSPLASQHMRCSRSTTTMCAVFFATPPRKVRKPHPRPPTIVT